MGKPWCSVSHRVIRQAVSVSKYATRARQRQRPYLTPYELFIGLRYTRAKRRNHFISFISLTSMLGIALGVAALITVLSVMNGFQNELRDPHPGRGRACGDQRPGDGLSDWQAVARRRPRDPARGRHRPVSSTRQGMLTYDGSVRGVLIRGILPEREEQVAAFASAYEGRQSDGAQAGRVRHRPRRRARARAGACIVGDKVTLIAPQGQVTPAGMLPRLKQFTRGRAFSRSACSNTIPAWR